LLCAQQNGVPETCDLLQPVKFNYGYNLIS